MPALTRLSILLLFASLSVTCGSDAPPASPVSPSPLAPPGAFALQGDPESAPGATWTYRGTIDGVASAATLGTRAWIPLVKPDDRPAPPTTARFGPDSWTEWWLYYTKLWLRADARLEQRLIETMVEQRAWLEPTLITEDWIANAESYRDAWANRGLPGTFEQTHEGSPLYSGRSLEEFGAAFDRMKDFVDCGLSPIDALRAATSDAASVLGWGDRVGRVEAGAAADLLVLDEDPLRDVRNVTTLHALVINGRHLDRSQLDALRASPRSRGQE